MKQLLLAVLAMGAASNAFAADAAVDEVVVVEDAFNWSGVYAGVHGGYSWGTAELDGGVLLGAGGGATFTSDSEPDGFLLGAHAGAQYQSEYNLVFGAEVDIDYRDVEETAPFFVDGVQGLDLTTEINWTASARLRAGYAIDRWLPYITGGIAWADLDLSSPNGDDSKTLHGWTVGLGTEYAFTGNLIFRAEYRYTDYDQIEDAFSDNILANGFSTFDLDSQDVTLGISYKF